MGNLLKQDISFIFNQQTLEQTQDLAFYLSILFHSLFTGGKVQLSFEELEDFAYANISKDPDTGRWLCSICGATFVNKLDVKRHIEAKHVVLPPLYCNMCNKAVKTSHSMRMHMKSVHNIISQY